MSYHQLFGSFTGLSKPIKINEFENEDSSYVCICLDALGSNKQGNCNCQLKILIWNTVTK